MARYKDAEKAIRAIKNRESADSFDFNEGLIAAMNAIDDVPDADVEEVKHGEWLFINRIGRKEMWMCNRCERCIIAEDYGNREIDLKRDYPYCHCGAKMDGKKGEKDGKL